MRCEDLSLSLISGEPLDEAARKHVDECPECQSFAALVANGVSNEQPDTANIESQLRSRLHPVKPIASDRSLIARLLFVFVLLCAAYIPMVHANGILAQSPVVRIVLLTAIALSALVSALAVVQLVVPGARRRVHPAWAFAAPILLIGVISVVVFPMDTRQFVQRGMPCLRMGVVCAIPAAVAGIVLLRRGYVTHRGTLAAVAGAFAGLAGVTALDMHCPTLEASHIAVWHLGVIVVCSAVSYLIVTVFDRLRG